MKVRNFALPALILLAVAACSSAKTIQAGYEAPATLVAAEVKVGQFVEQFGRQLQSVSPLAPDAVDELQVKYAPFVSPVLLKKWAEDLSKAPGRTVSSPWPDRIEVLTVTRQSPAEYLVTGQIIEVTSAEVANGGAFDKILVSITVDEVQGTLLISGYQQGKPQQ
jgi:hypothetical protein